MMPTDTVPSLTFSQKGTIRLTFVAKSDGRLMSGQSSAFHQILILSGSVTQKPDEQTRRVAN